MLSQEVGGMLKRSKYDKLFAVFESLCAKLAAASDDNRQR
jgi:hypothetical protein